MELKIITSSNSEWLNKWDNYVLNENKASHLLLSDWNKSFKPYGFDYEIIAVLENDTIIGGYAAVIAKALFFKFYIVPFGPIIKDAQTLFLNTLIENVKIRAKKFNCCYYHITLPFSSTPNEHVYNKSVNLEVLKNAKTGHFFKYVYSSNGFNWIDLQTYDEESKIMSLKPSVRRNIRNSYRKDLQFYIADTGEQIEQAYHLFLENSKNANYSIRDWKDVKNSYVDLHKKGILKILAATKDNELKGAILLVKSGNYYTYVLGGSKKEIPDLRTGDFLQWEAIKLSLNEELSGYNISLGGSKGVFSFKNSFNTEQIYFENSKYHWVLKPFYFKLYLFVEKYLKKYKKPISKILSRIKK